MESVSKTQLKIIKVETEHVFIHPTLNSDEFSRKDCSWQFSLDLFRTRGAKGTDKRPDKLKLPVTLKYYAPDNVTILASADVTTFIETKPLSLAEVDQELWNYLVFTGIAHCRGALAYKSKGTALDGIIIPALTSDQVSVDLQKKLHDVWG
jgi:hypothetical protein